MDQLDTDAATPVPGAGLCNACAWQRVVVSGRMPTFVDLGQTRVSEQATRPVERVTQP